MSKKDKKVSVRAMDEVVKSCYKGVHTDEWRGVEVVVKSVLSLTEMMAFVDQVVGSCFLDDGRFVPEVKDFAIKSNILSRYANISLPDNLEHRYQLIYCSDIVDFVKEYVNDEQLREITEAIESKIAHRCHTETIGVQRQLSKLADALGEVQKTATGLFDDISADDLKVLISAMTGGVVDEEKLVEAYLKQKAEPDTAD